MIGYLAGTARDDGRRQIRINNKIYLSARIVWLMQTGRFPCGVIDHINGNPSDDRMMNLRDATYSINNQNRRASNSSSGLMGVYKRRNAFIAQIRPSKGEAKYLGTFDTAEAAYAAYLDAKRSMHPGFVE
jgi:hypothetical protein